MRIGGAPKIERALLELEEQLIAVSSCADRDLCSRGPRSGRTFAPASTNGSGSAIRQRALERQLATLRRAGFRIGAARFEPVANGTKVTIDLSHRGARYTMVMNPAMSPAPCVFTEGLEKLSVADLIAMARGRSVPQGPKLSLAFVVSRIGGEDGVSLEAMHWMRILSKSGHPIHVITGQRSASNELDELERAGVRVHVIPEADPDPSQAENREEFEALFARGEVNDRFETKTDRIRRSIDSLIDEHGIDALMMENFTLPWHHLSMGVAAASVAQARRLPVVTRGHDFPHDRPAYRWSEADPRVAKLVEQVYLPLPSVAHVAINSRDVERYFAAMGIDDVTVVPNTIDTEDPRIKKKLENPQALKRAILGEAHADDFVMVCPVRPVARKRLDVAIDFVRRVQLVRPELNVSLLVTHDTVDASEEELARLRAQAKDAGVHLVFGHPELPEGFDTWDQYRIADVALYFSDFEGFGNALLEMLAFELPVVINEYEIFRRDIAPAGFELMQVRINGEDLGGQLDRRAVETLAILDRKVSAGAPLGEEDRARAGRNRSRLEELYSYPVVARALRELLWSAVRAPGPRRGG